MGVHRVDHTASQANRVVLVGVDLGPDSPFEASLDELAQLAESAGDEPVARLTARRRSPDPALFVGSGKAEEIKGVVVEHGAHGVLFDQTLSPAQQRNLERFLGVQVADRTVHALVVHLGLIPASRERQVTQRQHYIAREVPRGAPLIVAGDFNDWRNRVSAPMREAGFVEVFEVLTGSPARTFPSVKPILPMDRMYVRIVSASSTERFFRSGNLSFDPGISTQLELA